MMTALGSTSTVPQVTASTVETAAISTLQSSIVARNNERPPLLPPPPALPPPPPGTAAGDLVWPAVEPLPGDGRPPLLDILAPPSDDTEVCPLPLLQLAYNDKTMARRHFLQPVYHSLLYWHFSTYAVQAARTAKKPYWVQQPKRKTPVTFHKTTVAFGRQNCCRTTENHGLNRTRG